MTNGDQQNPESEFEIVITTCENLEQARKLAEEAISRRLAACGQIDGPIRSVYHWQNKIESGEEYRVWFKTRTKLRGELLDCLKRVHPYDVPQLLVVPIEAGNHEYLQWIAQETGSGDSAQE